ncbi:hypothetical protein CCACVL1_08183 [Corchorus capsularis]|uniref:Uncharacterized protein n=1 Tax=Corchorus capsularis TaxID=210143 RepID=A0A1R3J1W0_COCAP|nr:hypothetical protein CCACVL1_08183 [Corchorus capsularis]
MATALIVYRSQSYQGCGQGCKELPIRWL